jgi:hypothetical protein
MQAKDVEIPFKSRSKQASGAETKSLDLDTKDIWSDDGKLSSRSDAGLDHLLVRLATDFNALTAIALQGKLQDTNRRDQFIQHMTEKTPLDVLLPWNARPKPIVVLAIKIHSLFLSQERRNKKHAEYYASRAAELWMTVRHFQHASLDDYFDRIQIAFEVALGKCYEYNIWTVRMQLGDCYRLQISSGIPSRVFSSCTRPKQWHPTKGWELVCTGEELCLECGRDRDLHPWCCHLVSLTVYRRPLEEPCLFCGILGTYHSVR